MSGNLNAALGQVAAEDATKRAQRAAQQRAGADPKWYVAHAGGSDKRAEDTFKRGGIEYYYPQVAHYRPIPKRRLPLRARNALLRPTERVYRPLFPRWFFVRFDIRMDGWHEIFELAGMHGIIASDGSQMAAAPVADIIVMALQQREKDGAIDGSTEAQSFWFEIGEAVRVVNGPFAGFPSIVQAIPQGPIEALDESARMKLLVSIFGRETLVELPIRDVDAL